MRKRNREALTKFLRDSERYMRRHANELNGDPARQDEADDFHERADWLAEKQKELRY